MELVCDESQTKEVRLVKVPEKLAEVVGNIQSNLYYQKYESWPHVLDRECAREPRLLKERIQRLINFIRESHCVLINQIRWQDIELGEADDEAIKLLCGSRDRDWNQGEDRQRGQGAEQTPKVGNTTATIRCLDLIITEEYWQEY